MPNHKVVAYDFKMVSFHVRLNKGLENTGFKGESPQILISAHIVWTERKNPRLKPDKKPCVDTVQESVPKCWAPLLQNAVRSPPPASYYITCKNK